MAAATRLFVAAIDIGTTHSGYAVSAKDDFKEEPLKINVNVWNAGAKSLTSHKAPTALLLKPDKEFHSFGYEAENNYSLLVEDGEDFQEYYFFHRFKMILHNNAKLRRNTLVKDETNKSLLAEVVFAHTIRYLKCHLYRGMIDRYNCPDIKEEDIMYVLTVPAIWDDAAKQFMKEAAKLAGIKQDQLVIALEPEAAAIYCQYLPVEMGGLDKKTFLKVATSGTEYMVVDLGGGTADIAVHQRQADGTLKELRPASGGAWGGKAVDDEFRKFLEEIAGTNNIDKLKDESLEDFIDLFREFETKKKSITSDKPRTVSITMPMSLIELVKRDKNKKGFPEALKQSKYADAVTWSRQKLKIANDTFRDLFEPTIKGILDHIKDILTGNKFKDLHNILMVGGFSECELVQNAIRTTFSDKRIIVPDEAGLAVLKGAVLLGHIPRTITRRVARQTYGIQSCPKFEVLKHPLHKKVIVDGVARCKDVFFKYIQKGQLVTPGHEESQTFYVVEPDDEFIVYCSDQTDPTFVDDPGCRRLVGLTIPLDQRRGGAIEVKKTLIFGETELLLQAKDMATGRVYKAYFRHHEYP